MKAEYLDRANRIATDNVSSAQQVLRDTVDLLLDFCRDYSTDPRFIQDLKSLSDTLSNAQAQMAALSNIGRLIVSVCDKLPAKEVGGYIAGLKNKISEASARTAREASKAISAGKAYATLSQSEFVLRAFETAAAENKLAVVYVMESRPLFEGRQTARALKAMGHRSILVSDAAIGFFIDIIDSAFVGADAILSDGTLVNKIGSFALAAACKASGKDFHAVTSVLKFDREKDASRFLNKEESPHEIFPNPEYEVKNIYFDMVNPRLVTSVITEAGMLSPLSGLNQLETAMREIYG